MESETRNCYYDSRGADVDTFCSAEPYQSDVIRYCPCVKALPCDAPTHAPTNGAIGDCTHDLAHGSTCQPTCNAGFAASGSWECVDGTLITATCKVNCTVPTIAHGVQRWIGTGTGCGSGASNVFEGTTCEIFPQVGFACTSPGKCGADGNFAATGSCQACEAFTTEELCTATSTCEWTSNACKAASLFSLQNFGWSACHYYAMDGTVCGRCQGDCDDDSGCEPGLVCVHNPSDMSWLPGCKGGPIESYVDYCVKAVQPLLIGQPPLALPQGDSVHNSSTLASASTNKHMPNAKRTLPGACRTWCVVKETHGRCQRVDSSMDQNENENEKRPLTDSECEEECEADAIQPLGPCVPREAPTR